MSDLELDVLTNEAVTDDKKADITKCTYCGCLKDGVLVFYCDICKGWVHASCLHSGPPSPVLGDNYFVFKCGSCNETETFKRMKLTWVQVVSLALYNLAQSSLGKHGFFKWKEDICLFIEKYWDLFFGNNKKRTPQWSCSVGSILSSGNPHRFQSGYGTFKDPGWWRLADPTKSPAYQPGSPDNIVGTPVKPKRTYFGGSRSNSRKRSYFFSRAKQESVSFDENNDCSSPLSLTRSSSPASSLSSVPNQPIEKPKSPKQQKLDATLPLIAISDESDSEEINQVNTNKMPENDIKPKVNVSHSPKNEVENTDEKKILPMSLYEERRVLKKIISAPNAGLEARRLKRKLLLRQQKRSLGVPVFNFDKTAKMLSMKEKGMVVEDQSSTDTEHTTHFTAPTVVSQHSRHHKILDRFLSSDVLLHPDYKSDRTFKQKLIGCDNNEQQTIISPYTHRTLKPFIRRDYENKPLKLKLLQEIVAHYHKKDINWKPTKSAPIDYTYVRPRHIPAVNALCRHFFWPGIDLSESLQFPDFSVVALYKKMVIGFGFLVPDMAFNEAYISFLFVHPDWQRASIGTFMLYHLIQTCMGKDVTLHVSASNLSMLLYQRFGFKPERFDADFYDKYMPPDSQECNHAFFMRLRR